MNKEVWKDIPGFDGLYQVSNFGEVRRIHRYKYSSPHRVKCTQIIRGYLYVKLGDGKGHMRSFRVHRLVAAAFLGLDLNSSLVVNHKNFDRTDNRVENLEVVTREENDFHAHTFGKSRSGENGALSKLTNVQAAEIRRLYSTGKYSQNDLAKLYPVSRRAIGYIVTGDTYRV